MTGSFREVLWEPFVRYRSRTDIVIKILDIAMRGAVKTRIMVDAFLSFTQLVQYLSLLIDKGLLDYSEEDRKYRTTELGKYFLKVCLELGEMMTPRRTLYESRLEADPQRQ